jgi:large subunit ribosomal protein L6
MSRIGKKITTIPEGVTVAVNDGLLTVQGPKGKLERQLHSLVSIIVEDGVGRASVKNEENKTERALWGTFSSHLTNMVIGVTEGYKKDLEINGVGYRVAMQGTDLKIEVGFSHPVVFKVPEGIKATAEKNKISVEGIDKELVGRIASEIRSIKKPEPYKGKGIKYVDEIIRRKAGKTAKAA